RPRRRENIPNRYPDLRKDLRDLVHEGDVDVALGVLDRFRALGRLDGGSAAHAAAGDRTVNVRQLFNGLGILAGEHLGDLVDRMLAVALIVRLRAVAEPEIAWALKSGGFLYLRTANVLGDARIDRAFVDYRRAAFRIDQSGNRACCSEHRAKVRTIG